MRKIIAATFVSLDGVMQAPGGPEEDPTGGFSFGGWTFPYFDEALGASMDAIFEKPFDLLLGRKTYDIFAAYWPYAADGPDAPIAEAFNKAAKYVASRSTRRFGWNNSQWLGDDAVASLKRLKAGDGPDLLVQGSGDLVQTLLRHGLVDEFTVLVFPVLLGTGKRLFAGNSAVRPEGGRVAVLSDRRRRHHLPARRRGQDRQLRGRHAVECGTGAPQEPHLAGQRRRRRKDGGGQARHRNFVEKDSREGCHDLTINV